MDNSVGQRNISSSDIDLRRAIVRLSTNLQSIGNLRSLSDNAFDLRSSVLIDASSTVNSYDNLISSIRSRALNTTKGFLSSSRQLINLNLSTIDLNITIGIRLLNLGSIISNFLNLTFKLSLSSTYSIRNSSISLALGIIPRQINQTGRDIPTLGFTIHNVDDIITNMDIITTNISCTTIRQRRDIPNIANLSIGRQSIISARALIMQNASQLRLNLRNLRGVSSNSLGQARSNQLATFIELTIDGLLQSTNSSLQTFNSRSIRREPLDGSLTINNLDTELLTISSSIKAHQSDDTLISQMDGLFISTNNNTNVTQSAVSIDLVDSNDIIFKNRDNLANVSSTTKRTAIRAITLGIIFSIGLTREHRRTVQRESTSTLETHCPVKLIRIINKTSHKLFPPFLSRLDLNS